MMNPDNFNRVLQNPSQLQLSDLPMLNAIIEKYPYFQAPKAIRLKSLKEQESYLYNQKLKETAAYTVDRGVLFEFITSKIFNTSAITNTEVSEKQPVVEKKLESSIVSSTSNDNNSEEIKAVVTNTSAEAIKMTTDEADQIVDPFLFEEKRDDKETLSETELNIDAPLHFSKEETHSFTEWLKLASLQPIVREEKKKAIVPAPKKKLIESSLIDNFIKNNPKISPVKKDSPTVNLAIQNPVPTEDLMTETLAKVYLAQKNYKKAIQAYKILSLKNPEKSGLFADRIRAIEKLQHNKQ